MDREHPPACQRCGTCCQVDFSAYVTPEDIARWQAEDRRDILDHLEAEQAVWAGDWLVTAAGEALEPCSFLERDGDRFSCAIYATRPAVCRRFLPGDSPFCPQFSS